MVTANRTWPLFCNLVFKGYLFIPTNTNKMIVHTDTQYNIVLEPMTCPSRLAMPLQYTAMSVVRNKNFHWPQPIISCTTPLKILIYRFWQIILKMGRLKLVPPTANYISYLGFSDTSTSAHTYSSQEANSRQPCFKTFTKPMSLHLYLLP